MRMAGNLSTVHVRRRLVFSDVTLHDRLQTTGLLETLILPHRTADPISLYCVLDCVNTS